MRKTLAQARFRGCIAGGFTLIPLAIYSLSQFIHFILLGLWGLPWMLVGYVVFTNAAKREQGTPARDRTLTA